MVTNGQAQKPGVLLIRPQRLICLTQICVSREFGQGDWIMDSTFNTAFLQVRLQRVAVAGSYDEEMEGVANLRT